MMAAAAAVVVEVSASSTGSSSSDTSSTGEEERMRRLFQTCDGDGDGYISRNDLLMVCRQLNMEESVAEIMHQLGADENGKISFQDFTRCRMQLVREIRKEEVELSVKSDDSCKKKLRDRIASWPTSSDNSLDLERNFPIHETALDRWPVHRRKFSIQLKHCQARSLLESGYFLSRPII